MPIARSVPIMFLLLATAACQPSPDAMATPTPKSPHVDPASVKPVVHESTSAHPAPAPSAALTHWQCDDTLLDLSEDGVTSRIDFMGRSLTLQRGESLVGARYSDAKGNAFTRDGDQATLELADGGNHACTLRK